MNYLRSFKYLEGKDKLYGEYKDAFLIIEAYYIQVYTEQSYEIQISLKQILNDFIMAQETNKPLTMITGPDIKDYALNIIESNSKVKSGPLYWLTTTMILLCLFLFMMFARTLYLGDNYGYTLIEKMEHIYFNIDLLVVIILVYLFDFVKKAITKRLFYRSGLIKALNIFFALPLTLLIILFMKYTSQFAYVLGFRIPSDLFLVLAVITTTYIIVTGFISYRKTKAKKQVLMEYEEINIEQIVCPSCGHKHDIDYPKCPNCGYHSE